jgi:S-adenosylmethionine:tRNA-ribosyltransferase-isomerase (queuine synthetase)
MRSSSTVSKKPSKLFLPDCGKYITAVGTTSLRVLESLYWMGAKLILNPEKSSDQLNVQQWDPYEMNTTTITAKDALSALQQKMKTEKNRPVDFYDKVTDRTRISV